MKRPTFLTIWLALVTISNLFALYSYTLGRANITTTLSNFPSWAMTSLTLVVILQSVAVIMLWMWKKLGFYLMIVSAIIVASINGALFGVLGIGTSIFGIIGVGIMYLAMRPVWNNFK